MSKIQIKGRKLDSEVEEAILKSNIVKTVKKYDKSEKENIFLGIRNNAVNLYVAGGSALKVSFSKNDIKCELDDGYIKNKKSGKYYNKNKEVEDLEKLINKGSKDINEWLKEIQKIIDIIIDYQYASKNEELHTKREKIAQQKLCYAFNHNKESLYYAYDMEYNIEGFKNDVKDINGKVLKTSTGKNKQITPGRADIMLIKRPDKNKKIKIIFMEVKEETGAFSGVSKKEKTFGSGIVGHMRNYMPVIYDLNTSGMVYTDRLQEKINLKKHILEEVKYTMKFYQDNNLITNPNFKDIDYNELNEDNTTFELAFYLVGYKENATSFENHLGINTKNKNAEYNVKELLEEKDAYKSLGLQFLNIDGIRKVIDFKYVTTPLTYDEISIEDINTNIDEYKKISFKDILEK